ncbi:MAG TPA: glycoside hydrolase family 20 zincin-like fold domain-containing protein [Thermoanaerobaculia bacterium]|nr:glycoside hydrolase family 20 zincin-like fold domain-containing protein [Thermoanaerobaculia bacterium]
MNRDALDPLDLLLPRPLRATRGDGAWRATSPLHLQLAADGLVAETAVDRLARALAAQGIAIERGGGDRADLRLAVADPAENHTPESYRLAVDERGVDLHAADPRGLAHGVSTLLQWVAVAGERRSDSLLLPALVVEDRPAFRHRGVLLDVSRDRVPRMETLLGLVDLLAGWKVNQLQLYVEHTFAYVGHETVWRDASPITAEEIHQLDSRCAALGVDLVPNQNSFGHFHRWLVHEPYRQLAECPDGVEHPWAFEPQPFSLCATDPGSLDLLADLYDQLLPHFRGDSLNVGLDESFDLGRCRSRDACEERGRHHVYVEYLRAVHRLAAERGRRIQFWGDIVLEEPAVIPDLPADAVALDWGYEAGHPFAEHGAAFAAAGLEHWVCPGTSTWASLTGRTSNAVTNVAEAAAAGHASGATGLLLTDWGDYGHLQPWPASLPGFAAGAAAAWNPQRPVDREELPALLDAHAFLDAAGGAGTAVCDLGDVYLASGGGNVNGTALFHLLLRPGKGMDEGRNETLSEKGLQEVLRRVDAALDHLAAARMGCDDTELTAADVRWGADAVRFAARLGLARLAAGREVATEALPAGERGDLLADFDDLLDRHRALRLARHRPGGLAHALAYFEPLRRALGAG